MWAYKSFTEEKKNPRKYFNVINTHAFCLWKTLMPALRLKFVFDNLFFNHMQRYIISCLQMKGKLLFQQHLSFTQSLPTASHLTKSKSKNKIKQRHVCIFWSLLFLCTCPRLLSPGWFCSCRKDCLLKTQWGLLPSQHPCSVSCFFSRQLNDLLL